jgi:hypothetical protein
VNRFEDLTARYYENDLDDRESGELRDMIDGSPDLLREFVIAGVREEQLRAALRSSCALEDSLPASGVRKRRRKLRVLGLAAAAVVALSVATWTYMTRGVEVEVVASRDLRVSNGSLSPEAGSRGRVRDLTI